MIKFLLKADGKEMEIQFPTAMRPDDRVVFMVSDTDYQAIVNITISGRSDERGLLMQPNVGTPIGIYQALQERGLDVSGAEDWELRPTVM